jgi:glycosyltransferase involved in cell wall biosynthesis
LKVLELGGDPAKVIVHHIGIPVLPPTPPDVEKRWDVAFVGRFVEKKGIFDLVAALGQLRPELQPRCVFVGDGPLSGRVREAVQEAGIDVTFLGAQPPDIVQATLKAARVFAAPSRTAANGDSEGFGMVFLEAAAAGLPVVSTRHGGIPEAVLDGETGLLSSEGDVDALAENLRSLLLSPDLRARLGAAGRRRVESEFDIVKQTELLEEIYDSVSRRIRPVL